MMRTSSPRSVNETASNLPDDDEPNPILSKLGASHRRKDRATISSRAGLQQPILAFGG